MISVRVEFDADKVKSSAAAGSLQGLRRAGAYVRKVARNSIRRSAKPSPPGSPPHTFRGALKRSILFDVEKSVLSVCIGPSAAMFSDTARYHEFGGVQRKRKATVRKHSPGQTGPVARRNGKAVYAKIRTQRQASAADRIGASQAKRPRHYPKRPFMGPALVASAGKLSGFWRNSMKE